jgi:hypothetical protein
VAASAHGFSFFAIGTNLNTHTHINVHGFSCDRSLSAPRTLASTHSPGHLFTIYYLHLHTVEVLIANNKVIVIIIIMTSSQNDSPMQDESFGSALGLSEDSDSDDGETLTTKQLIERLQQVRR